MTVSECLIVFFSVDDELSVFVRVDNTAISLTPAPAGVVSKLELEHRFDAEDMQ